MTRPHQEGVVCCRRSTHCVAAPPNFAEIVVRRFLSRIAVPLALAIACGSSTQVPVDTTPKLSVGGTYTTTVAVLQSSCPGLTVANTATTVSHTAGASTLTVSHAGNDYPGNVTPQGDFTTQARAVSGGGETHTLVIVGKFSTSGFTATVNAAVARTTAPTTCSYSVSWTGTRTIGTNTFP
jgi:hypothetical protein